MQHKKLYGSIRKHGSGSWEYEKLYGMIGTRSSGLLWSELYREIVKLTLFCLKLLPYVLQSSV